MARGIGTFRKDTEGSSTIEFVVVFLGFIATITFVVQTSIYLYMQASIQKAVDAGVRLAAISAPMTGGSDLLQNIQAVGSNDNGKRCWPLPTKPGEIHEDSPGRNPCVPFGTYRCGAGAGGCGGPFNSVLAEMRGYNANIAARNVTITYSDVGIGFAGGPRRPMVTVKVSGVNFDGGILGLLLSFAEDGPPLGNPTELTLPSATASMPTESLGQ